MKKKKMIPLIYMMNFWKNQKIENDKGGSFNLPLYLKICEIKMNQNG